MVLLPRIFTKFFTSENTDKKEAQRLEEEQKYIKAIDKYIELLNKKPGDKKIYLNLGILYAKLDKNIESFEMYKSILLLHPDYTEPLNEIKKLFKKGFSPPLDFLKELQKKAKSTKQKKLLLLIIGSIHENKKEYTEAISVFEKLLSLNPRDKDVLYILLKLYNQTHACIEKRQKVMEKLFKLEPDDKSLCLELSEIYDKTGHKYPKDMLERLIVIYEEQKDWEKLTDNMERLLNNYYLTKKEKLDILNRLGFIYIYHLDETNKAIEKYEALLKIDKHNKDLQDKLLYLHYATQHYDTAIEKFNELIDRNPLDASSYYFMAKVFKKHNLLLQAFFAIEIALVLKEQKEYLEGLNELKNLYSPINNLQIIINSDRIFDELIVVQKEKEFLRLFNWIKPILEQFYTYEIDKEILLNSGEVIPEHLNPMNREFYQVIEDCSKILKMKRPDIYIYNGKVNFNIILSENEKSAFMIINSQIKDYTSEKERYFILGQELTHIKRNNIIYRQLSRDLPAFLSEFIIDTIVSNVPLPLPKNLRKSSFTKIPLGKLTEIIKKATLSTYFLQWTRKVTRDHQKVNAVENMFNGLQETADRCGFLSCGSLREATNSLIKYQCNLWKNFNEINIKDLLEKDKALQQRIIKLWKFALGKDFMGLFRILKKYD